MKRELERISGPGSVNVDSPRGKRRKEHAQAAMPATTPRSNNVPLDPGAIMFKQNVFSLSGQPPGMRQTKSALPSLTLTTALMPVSRSQGSSAFYRVHTRLRSKRHYADSYQQIQNTVALDEIGSRMGTGKYTSLDAVRQDLELYFKNAKEYSVKDDPIWKDAKHLHVCWRRQLVVYVPRLASLRNLSTRNTSG